MPSPDCLIELLNSIKSLFTHLEHLDSDWTGTFFPGTRLGPILGLGLNRDQISRTLLGYSTIISIENSQT